MINILLIGCGYHAKRIHIPFIKNMKGVKLCAVIDLKSEKEKITDYFKSISVNNIDLQYTNVYKISDSLTDKEKLRLNSIIKTHLIDAVIISTEPLAHFKYAKWALEQNLHILMDKPVTTELDVSVKKTKAKKLYNDYIYLKKLYKKKIIKKNIIFTLLAQRRHHTGFKRTRDLIIEMSKKTNCPVTSIQTFHSDGQWRFPKEILNQKYHPYNQGYGKMSHSGYHGLDTAIWFAQSSIIKLNKKYNNYEIYSQFVRPLDFIYQFNSLDYLNLFPNINKKELITNENFKKLLKTTKFKSTTGEIDAHSLIALRHNEITITNIAIHAIHNGFSQRNWTSTVDRDLYKGNGRVRQESYIIEQGPFQSIIVNSYQSHELFKSEIGDYDVGGEYHYDIHIFRNNTLFPEYKNYELITMKDINLKKDTDGYSRGHQENARRDCIDEFIQAIKNNDPIKKQQSNFLDHDLSTLLLSAIYQSASNAKNKRIVQGKIK